MQALAELGFIVVQIDGMGTIEPVESISRRGWKNLGDAGFPDRILWHKAAPAKYPYYDITRVGIYGGSAGGQNALGGLLFHPDFYKVGGRRMRVPRQPDGQDRLERAVDGLAGRPALRGHLERRQRAAAAGQAAAHRRRAGHERRPRVHHAGRERADQGQQDVRFARGAERRPRCGPDDWSCRIRPASTRSTFSSSISWGSRRRTGTARSRLRRPRTGGSEKTRGCLSVILASCGTAPRLGDDDRSRHADVCLPLSAAHRMAVCTRCVGGAVLRALVSLPGVCWTVGCPALSAGDTHTRQRIDTRRAFAPLAATGPVGCDSRNCSLLRQSRIRVGSNIRYGRDSQRRGDQEAGVGY